ncbi:MAG: integrase arm-type DNA-binding domain-containing protein [Hyphomicrobiaceae bacterium]|nr:tyrosine-type recombinase/integrase [Hyphomicrobiaceae bacterium]
MTKVKLSARTRLTDRACATATFPSEAMKGDPYGLKDKRFEIRDTKCEGLELRITPTGSKTWVVRYRRKSDGTKRTMTLGRYPDKSLEDARIEADKARIAAGDGADPAAGVQERKAAPTFADTAELWLAHKRQKGRSERSLRDVESMLRVHINPIIGHMKLPEIRRRDLARMLDGVDSKTDGRAELAKRRKPNADGTTKASAYEGRKLTQRTNHVFAWTRAIVRWALSRDMLEIDPTSGLKSPADQSQPRDRVLSPDEIKALWSALEAAPIVSPPKRQEGDFPMTRATALAMQLALVTGQRIGEVAETAVAELSLNDVAPLWTIPKERAKNGRKHEVPLSPLAVRLIREALALGEARFATFYDDKLQKPKPTHLFSSANCDGSMHAHAPTRALGRARGSIEGVERFNVHDLRRTCATQLGELGVSPHVISAVLNHVSTARASITQAVYNKHTYTAEKRDALERWGRRLDGIVAGSEGANVVAMKRS